MPLRKIAINLTCMNEVVDLARVDTVCTLEEAQMLLQDVWGRADLMVQRLNDGDPNCKPDAISTSWEGSRGELGGSGGPTE
jgi:hypothetical protein